MECGILAIKKTSVKTLQIGLYPVFLNMPIKYVQERDKKFDCKKKKNNILLSQLLFNCNIEKTKIMIFYVNFVCSTYIYFG